MFSAADIDHDDKGYVQDPCDGVVGDRRGYQPKRPTALKNFGKSRGVIDTPIEFGFP
jgi:hypothetical protein